MTITYLCTEASKVSVVGQAADRSGAIPQGPAAISVSLVFLEQLEKLEEDDPITNTGTAQLLQVGLLYTQFPSGRAK